MTKIKNIGISLLIVITFSLTSCATLMKKAPVLQEAGSSTSSATQNPEIQPEPLIEPEPQPQAVIIPAETEGADRQAGFSGEPAQEAPVKEVPEETASRELPEPELPAISEESEIVEESLPADGMLQPEMPPHIPEEAHDSVPAQETIGESLSSIPAAESESTITEGAEPVNETVVMQQTPAPELLPGEAEDQTPQNLLPPEEEPVAERSEQSETNIPAAAVTPQSKEQPKVIAYTSLLQAVADSNYKETERLILAGKNLQETDMDGKTPLHIAAANGDSDIVRLLLKHGADPAIPDNAGDLPIHFAIMNSFSFARLLAGNGELLWVPGADAKSPIDIAFDTDLAAVKALLEEDLVNIQNNQGETPLHAAVERGSRDLAATLIDLGADLNVRDNEDRLPIDIAFSFTSSQSHVAIAILLIRNYSDIPQNQHFYYAYQAFATTGINARFENGDTVLHLAAMHKHYALLTQFITAGASLESRNEWEDSPLHIAVKQNDTVMVEKILEAGANANARDTNNATPLHLAIANKDSQEIIKMLLNYGADLASRNILGETPLHIAMNQTHQELIALLLDRGADPNARDRNGDTPIMLALAKNNSTAAQILLTRGADLYAQNNQSITPLMRACMKGEETIAWFYAPWMNTLTDINGQSPLHSAIQLKSSPAVLEIIIHSGANLNAADYAGETPLHIAVKYQYPEAIALLVSKGADQFIKNNRAKSALVMAFELGASFTQTCITESNLEAGDVEGNTPLLLAVYWDYTEITEFLLSLGANPQASNNHGATPLHFAVKNNNIKICQLLTKAGANVNLRDSYGNTPLHTSITWQSLSATKYLILMKAQINLRNLSGNAPLHTAVLYQDLDSIRLLQTYGASLEVRDNMGMTTLLLATSKNFEKTAALLIDLGADLQSRDDRGNTSLHEAIRNRNLTIAKMLVNRGADMYAENRYHDTPLSLAFSAGITTVEGILTPSAINTRDDKGNTPLHSAILSEAPEDIIRLIIDKGVDINSRNSNIDTPLHLALKTKNTHAAQILAAAGADLFAKNSEGVSPLVLAFKQGEEAVRWILDEVTLVKTDELGNSPLHAAVEIEDPAAIVLLLAMGADPAKKNLAGISPAMLAGGKTPEIQQLFQ